ncbi:MAG: DUF167 domain-containing protein [Candidatus Nanohaloarchaea archaeon]
MTEIDVKVETGKDEFSLENGYMVKVGLTEEPENGRANAELVRELEKVLGKKPGIIRGHSSRRKKLKVDLPEEEVERKLEDA